MRDTTTPDSRRTSRPARLSRRLLAVSSTAAALVLGPQAALASAATTTTRAAVEVNTDGLQDILIKNALPLAIALIGLLIVLSGRKKDVAGSMTMTGITLLGLGVVGLAAMATPVGDALVGLIISEG